MDWQNPEARAELLARIGPTAYRREHAAAVDRSTLGFVNGYRLVSMGPLIAVDGTRRAFKTEAAARTYADSQPPRELGTPWVLA